MRKTKYEWKYGENECQKYYDVKLGKDYLCIYANKKYPDVWMGMYIKNRLDITVMDKTFNNRQRKKDEKNGVSSITGRYLYPRVTKVLGNKDIEKMKRKIEYAYEHNLTEVSNG